MSTEAATTVSFIAKRIDRRCKWWAVKIPAGEAASLRLDDTTSTRRFGFLAAGADLELSEGDAVVISEQRHHRKDRGYDVALHVVIGGKVREYRPGAATKASIKAAATPEQWTELKDGSGEVAACLRLLKAIGMFSAEQFRAAFPKTTASLAEEGATWNPPQIAPSAVDRAIAKVCDKAREVELQYWGALHLEQAELQAERINRRPTMPKAS